MRFQAPSCAMSAVRAAHCQSRGTVSPAEKQLVHLRNQRRTCVYTYIASKIDTQTDRSEDKFLV